MTDFECVGLFAWLEKFGLEEKYFDELLKIAEEEGAHEVVELLEVDDLMARLGVSGKIWQRKSLARIH